jgi:hypothetical protein
MKSKFLGILLFLIFLTPGSLLAQGLFQSFGLPRTVAATGQTEVLGGIIVSMTQGPVAADTLVIDVSPLQITNAHAADISVTTVGLTVGATTIDTTNNLVQIPVTSSSGSTASMTINGIRVAIAGTNTTSLNAKLSWLNGQNFFTGASSVRVISAVQSALVTQPIMDPFVIYAGQLVRSTSTIHVAEGFATAFSNSAQYGQTGPTQVRIRVTDFPDGIQMVFPASVTANESAAALTTVGGNATGLTSAFGNNIVTYNFNKIAESDNLTESFDIKFSVNIIGAISDTPLQPTIEVTLAPIGGATPNATFPATDIPRYAEDEQLVQAGTSRTITKILYWTGIDGSFQNQVHITNASGLFANLTIDAVDSTGKAVTGAGITNPAKLSLTANQSIIRSVSDLFGNAAGVASIRIQSTNPDLLAVAVVTGNGVNEAAPFMTRAVTGAAVPVVNATAKLQLMNPGSAPVNGTITIHSPQGALMGSTQVNIAPLASTTVSLTALSNGQSGYATLAFSDAVIAFESFGSSNLMAVTPPAEQGGLFIPFVAGGNGFQTDANVVNTSDQTITLQAQLFTASGSQSGSTQTITLAPGQQLASSLQSVFSVPQLPDTGYVRIYVQQLSKGFFKYYPTITGFAQIRSSQGGSTAIPLSTYQLADAFVLGDGVGSGSFEGVSMVNPTAAPVSVTVQALNLDGSVAGTATLTLNAGQAVSQLTSQLFTSGIPPQTVIRVTASAPIAVTAIIGSTGLDQFRALPVLR